MMYPLYLYHGSPHKLEILEPKISKGDSEPLVYATDRFEFALFYAGNATTDLEINQSYYDGIFTLTEIMPGMFRKVLDRPGYVYCLDAGTFEHIDDKMFVSREAVIPEKVLRIPNVLQKLKSVSTKMYKFPNLPYYIKSRSAYAEERCRLFHSDYEEWKREYDRRYREWRHRHDKAD